MATFNPYLHFPGNTEEAFNFYKSVLGGEFIKTVRYKVLPQSDENKIPERYLNKIMRIALPIGKGNILMGADAIESIGQKLTIGDNFTISISAHHPLYSFLRDVLMMIFSIEKRTLNLGTHN